MRCHGWLFDHDVMYAIQFCIRIFDTVVFARDLRVKTIFGKSVCAVLAVTLATTLALVTDSLAGVDYKGCREWPEGTNRFVVCAFKPSETDIRLFLNNAENEPYSHFDRLDDALNQRGERLEFAMNAGMYHQDRTPVGLYVEDGEELRSLNTNDGPGNFHLKPNGVFAVLNNNGRREAAVVSSDRILNLSRRGDVMFATQSGPMLVIDGKIHPRFLRDSDSLKRRNGVGVTADGAVIFVIADTPVRFYDFAVFFRDRLETENALFLDGSVSRLFAPPIARNDPGAAMGPVVGVVAQTN